MKNILQNIKIKQAIKLFFVVFFVLGSLQGLGTNLNGVSWSLNYGDVVTIQGWTSVTTLTANVSCAGLIIDNGAILELNGYTLTVNGDCSTTQNSAIIRSSSGSAVLIVTGNITTNGYNSNQINLGANGTLKVAGNLQVSGEVTFSVGTLEMNGCAQTMEINQNFSVSIFKQSSSCGTTIGMSAWSTITVATYDQNCNATNIKPTTYFTITGSTINATCGSASPTLTAAGSATVDANFNITFTDDATWRAAITQVRYGSNTLTVTTDYTINEGSITLKPSGSGGSGLRTAGTQTVTVLATGYINATVSQTIVAGLATQLEMKTQPSSTTISGLVIGTQPEVYVKDQYGNLSSGTVVANVGVGTWSIGGTTSKASSSGVATFTNLTATGLQSGATISFTCGALSVSSNSFNIIYVNTNGDGLLGTYHSNQSFSAVCGTRIENINFYPTGITTNPCSNKTDDFSVRWTGYIIPLYSETYTFYGWSDDNLTININGTEVLNTGYSGSEVTGGTTIALTAGTPYPITVSYVEAYGGEYVSMSWSSASQSKQIVPQSQLFSTDQTPLITVSETTRTGFSYCTGSGPSVYQAYIVSGANLTENITITAPTNYEISTASASGYGASLTLNHSSGTVNSTTIYVRLKAGLGVAAYNGQVITHASTGATTKNVTCSGSVVSGTSITVSSATITGFSGCDATASPSQSYTVSGQCLSGDMTITPPSDYQISVDDFNWVTSPTTITLSPTSGNIGVTTIYVRLRPGLTVNSYNAQIITHTGGGAAQQNVTCSGAIYAFPTANAGADIYVCNSTFYQVNATSTAYTPYVGSGAYVTGGSDDNQGGAIDRTNVVNPAPEGVYQTGRNGVHDYTFTGLTSGSIYLIRLHFSEHWGAPGQRQFNVAINGVSKLTNFDINVAAGGLNKAVVREFFVAANGSGQIIVSFTNGAENTALSRGVELYGSGQLTATGGGTYLWNTGETSASIYVGPTEATYTVTVTSNGCSSQDAVQVAEGCGTPAPFLTAASNASVDAPFEVTFTDNATWRGEVTSVTVNGTTLTGGYVISSGKITFTPSASTPANLLQASGSKTIRVLATGYTNSAVTQTINPGVATKLVMKTQPVAPVSNGAVFATQPQVYIQDQYSNVTTSNAVVTAAVGVGTWTIGGSTAKPGSLGTAAFANLTASSAGAVAGATIAFTSPGLTSVTSTTFSIPDLSSVTIASPSQTGASNIQKKSTKQIISAFTIAVATASTQLQSIVFTTAGTYAASDVVNFKLWYHSSNDITAATQVGGEITSGLGAGSHTFSNLSHAIASGATRYMWITVDVAENANYGKTINCASIANADITFASGTKSGSVTTGGTKTIVLTTTLTGFNYIGAGPSKYQTFNLASTSLSSASGTITVTAPTNYEISKSPNSGYASSLNYTYASSSISANDGIVYVRLKAGLSAGNDYNGETITFSGVATYNSLTVTCSGGVGQIYYFRQTGNWTDGNTWSLSCGGGAAGSYPTYKDSAVCTCVGMGYDAGYVLTVNTDLTVGAIYIDRKLDISSSNVTLTVKNNLQLGKTDTWWEGQGSINVGNGTLVVEGDLILGYNNDSNGLKWDNGNIYVGGNLICSDGGGPEPLVPGTDAYQNLSLRPGGGPESDPWAGTVPTYAGSIIMTGENKSIVVNAAAVDLVNIKLESSTITKTGSGTLYITENMDFNGQSTFENSVGSVIISGTITNAENATLINDAIVKIATTTNNLAVHSGTAGSTTEYFTIGDEPVNVGTYYNLTISGGGTKTLQGDIIINHQLYFPDAGYIDLNGYDLTMNDWENGNIYPITSADRYIISSNGTFVINGVDVGEIANFPIGLSAAAADYARVDIQNADGTKSFTITGLCDGLYSDGTCGGTNGGFEAFKNAVDLTWYITSASTNATMTLYWHTSRHLTDFNTTSCAVFHYGSQWDLRPTQGAVSTYDTEYRYKTGTINSFSPFSVQNGEGLLPIELVSFTAKQKPLGTVLQWETASEQNNDFFTLYRSNTGIQFAPIAQIAGAGNSSTSKEYSYFDASVYPGITYYQLSQTDYDGSISYSDIVSTYVELPNFELLSYKNENFTSIFEIQFADYDVDNTLRVVNLLGKIVYEQVFTHTSFERVEISLPVGSYTLVNTNSNSVFSQKIIVKK